MSAPSDGSWGAMFFFSSRSRHTGCYRDWSSDVCSSDMFVHAYQSYLFNRILSERMRRGLPLNEPLEGDLVLPLDKKGLPDRDRPLLVEAANLEKMRRQVRDGKAFVSGALFGSEAPLAAGPVAGG